MHIIESLALPFPDSSFIMENLAPAVSSIMTNPGIHFLPPVMSYVVLILPSHPPPFNSSLMVFKSCSVLSEKEVIFSAHEAI